MDFLQRALIPSFEFGESLVVRRFFTAAVHFKFLNIFLCFACALATSVNISSI